MEDGLKKKYISKTAHFLKIKNIYKTTLITEEFTRITTHSQLYVLYQNTKNHTCY